MKINKVIGKEMIWEWAVKQEIKKILESFFKKEYGNGVIEKRDYDYEINTMLKVVFCSEILCLDKYSGEQLSLNSGICYIKDDFDSWKQKKHVIFKNHSKTFCYTGANNR